MLRNFFINFLFTFTLEDKIWLKKRVCHTKKYIYNAGNFDTINSQGKCTNTVLA
jgi:hypothetical protein